MARSAAARKAAQTDSDIPSHTYGRSPVSTLVIAKENPRTIRRPEDVEALAANIRTHGVLEPLVIYSEGGKGHVTVGGTRLLAAQRAGLADLPIMLLPKDAAIAAGLAEQEGHTPLHPADQARAYAAELARLNGEGPITRDAAVRTIANRVGKTPRFVEQRLALAALHPPILKALREDKIVVKQAEAWANADVELQADLWKAKGSHALDADPFVIKQLIDKQDLADTDRLVKFIGKEAYEAAGGGVKRDLFSVELEPWMQDKGGARFDGAIVKRVAKEKLAAAKERTEKEGWGEVETTLARVSLYGQPKTKACATKAAKAKHGVRIWIADNGKLAYLRGIPLKADAKKAAENRAATSGGAGLSEKDVARQQQLKRTCDVAEQIVGRSLKATPGLAINVLLAIVAGELVSRSKRPVNIDAWAKSDREHHGLKSDAGTKTTDEITDPIEENAHRLEVYVANEMTPAQRDRLAAWCVTVMLELNEYSVETDKEGIAWLAGIGRLAGADLNAHLTDTVADKVDLPLLRELIGLGDPPKAAKSKKPAVAK